jgi:hypothetical protein
MAADQGEFEAARALHEEGLGLARELGDRCAEAWALQCLGADAVGLEDLAAAVVSYLSGLELFGELEDLGGVCTCLSSMAWTAVLAVEAGSPPPLPLAAAVRIQGAAEALFAGQVAAPAAAESEARAGLRTLVDDATFAAAWAEGQAMTLQQAVACALREANADRSGATAPGGQR